VQAVASTNSYGKRYTAFLLLNIVSRGEDDDGAGSPEPKSLSDEQHAELIKLAEEVGADIGRFCALFKVDSLVDIPALRFSEAKAQLLRKKRAKESKAEASDFGDDAPTGRSQSRIDQFSTGLGLVHGAGFRLGSCR
jgi:hypothetical protein